MEAGQLMAGASVSWTVMVNEQEASPATFEAEQETVFVPTGNELPEGGEQVISGSGKPVALGLKMTTAEH